MLIRTIPKDQTSAARGLYTGATLFLHSVKQSIEIRRGKKQRGIREQRTIAHIRCATTVHIRRDGITSRETKVGEFHDDFALMDTVLVDDPAIGNDEIFRFDVTMKNGRIMASGYGLTHLGKHRGDKAETGVGEELGRVKGRKEARCWWSMGQRRIAGRINVVMITGLFEKIE